MDYRIEEIPAKGQPITFIPIQECLIIMNNVGYKLHVVSSGMI